MEAAVDLGDFGAERRGLPAVAELVRGGGEFGQPDMQVPQRSDGAEMVGEAAVDLERGLVMGVGGGGVAEVDRRLHTLLDDKPD